MNDHRLQTWCIIILLSKLETSGTASFCLTQESTEAGEGALCTAVWWFWCQHHASHIPVVWVASTPLSLLPDLGVSNCLLVQWDRAAPPHRQAGSREQGRIPSEMISIHPRVSSLSTLMDELMKQREGGGLVLDINSWRSAERYSVFLQGGHFTPGVCSCVASKWFVCYFSFLRMRLHCLEMNAHSPYRMKLLIAQAMFFCMS